MINNKPNWLYEPTLQKLLTALSNDNNTARVVGGAVRNNLLNIPFTDIDIATTCTPDETIHYAENAGFKTKPTGKSHGTISVIANHKCYEVTSLREDIATDGRHAVVKFSKDWSKDAERRDFTINALYMDKNGEIYDYTNGIEDIKKQNIRFIGDAETRIKEDYLRILRFFRFYTYYGKGAPNSEAILACTKLKGGLKNISAERIWSETKKIISAPDPVKAILWMRKSGVLDHILPETIKWGVDLLPALRQAEIEYNWDISATPLVRLQAIIPKNIDVIDSLCKRLKLSNKEKNLLQSWYNINVNYDDVKLSKEIYLHGKDALMADLKLKIAQLKQKHKPTERYIELLICTSKLEVPTFPIRGQDLVNLNYTSGKEIGSNINKLKEIWLQSNCQKTRQDLLEIL